MGSRPGPASRSPSPPTSGRGASHTPRRALSSTAARSPPRAIEIPRWSSPPGRSSSSRSARADVLHSFFIPAMRFRRYAYPDSTNRFVLTFPHGGGMLGEGALQLCGWDHAEMRFRVTALPVARFRAWLGGPGSGRDARAPPSHPPAGGRRWRALDRPQVRHRPSVACSVSFFLAGGVLALVMRCELAVPGMQVVSHQEYNELFTMHGSTMVYLVVQPLALALGVYLVPLQVGAADDRRRAPPSWACGCRRRRRLMYLGFLTTTAPAGRVDGLPAALERRVHTGGGMDLWVLGVTSRTSPGIVLAGVVLRRSCCAGPRDDPAAAAGLLLVDGRDVLMVLLSFPALIAAMGAAVRSTAISRRTSARTATRTCSGSTGTPTSTSCSFRSSASSPRSSRSSPASGSSATGDGVLAARLRGALDERVGPPHVHDGPVPNEYFALTSTLAVAAGVEYFDILGRCGAARCACARRCCLRSPSSSSSSWAG